MEGEGGENADAYYMWFSTNWTYGMGVTKTGVEMLHLGSYL